MDDLIRRSDVIGLIEDMLLFGEYDIIASSFSKADEEKVYRAIDDIPAVNRWIPCSERLPGRFDSVLLAILSKNGYGEPAYYVTIGGMKSGTEFESYTGDICECEKVTHWMPLPEPPKEDEAWSKRKTL